MIFLRCSPETSRIPVCLVLLSALCSFALPAHATDSATGTGLAGRADKWTGTPMPRPLFFHALAPHGTWALVEPYGYCWQPSDIPGDWRPYSIGRWGMTPAGWTWLSPEPFAWAVYHYGSWIRLKDEGWIWIPDEHWAPARVQWRIAAAHIAWAPLPPQPDMPMNPGRDPGPSMFCVVNMRHFGASQLQNHILPEKQNAAILSWSRDVPPSATASTTGPNYELANRLSLYPIPQYLLRHVSTPLDADWQRPTTFCWRQRGETVEIPTPPSILPYPPELPEFPEDSLTPNP